jgi:hypothetical protein
MNTPETIPLAARWLSAGTVIAAALWVAYSVFAWLGYGRWIGHGRVKRPASPDEGNTLLHRLMPVYEVVEYRQAYIAVPPEIALTAAISELGHVGHPRSRELVFWAITRPWELDVISRSVGPVEVAAFDEPGYAKIAWSLRVEPAGEGQSVVRAETRVTTTDPDSRAKFRRNWAFLVPGIRFPGQLSLKNVKREAERSAQQIPDAEPEQSVI